VHIGAHRIDLIQHHQLGVAVDDALAGRRAPLLLASANLDHVYRFERQTDLFATTPDGQWLVLLDGMPLVWACRRKTGRAWDRLAGADLLPDLLTQAEARDAGVGFVGGSDAARRALAPALEARWPRLRVAGHWTPTREVVDDRRASSVLASEIADARTDILVVGLGKPRQEQWMARHASATGARVTGAFGASADFISGIQKRAPEVLSRVGGEWLYRLARDPRRLARRYLAEGPVALARVARDARSAA
jgi:exopolysaccharide biosynthesis WecB/TagA/CpsF family protein